MNMKVINMKTGVTVLAALMVCGLSLSASADGILCPDLQLTVNSMQFGDCQDNSCIYTNLSSGMTTLLVQGASTEAAANAMVAKATAPYSPYATVTPFLTPSGSVIWMSTCVYRPYSQSGSPSITWMQLSPGLGKKAISMTPNKARVLLGK